MVDDDDDRGANYGVEDDGTTLKIYLTILSQIPHLKASTTRRNNIFMNIIIKESIEMISGSH